MLQALGRPLHHPAVRAGLTSATVMAAGDVICQKIQKRTLAGPVDWRRAGRFAVVGLAIHGPFFLYGFKWLDTIIKGEPGLKTAFIKTCVGQVTLFPVYLSSCLLALQRLEGNKSVDRAVDSQAARYLPPTCLLALQLLEGKSVDQAVDKVKSVLVPTMVAGAVFWPAANMFNFMFVPSSGRILYVNAAGLVWNAYLSLVNSQKAEAKVEEVVKPLAGKAVKGAKRA